MSKLSTAIRQAMKRTTAIRMWPATIVTSGGKTGYTKVKFSNGVEMEVLNYRIASIPDLKISVGYDPMMPGDLQVLGIRESLKYLGEKSSYLYFLPDHHGNHEYPNHDVVWVQGAQFIPNNVLPKGGNLEVQVYGSIMRKTGDWVAIRSATLDMTTHLPTTGARYSLIEVDANGSPVVTDGTAKTLPSLTVGDIPEPTPGRLPIAAILLRAGQTTVERDVRYGHRNDILDLRWSGYARGGHSDDFDMAGAIHDATASTLSDEDEFGFWENVAIALRKITWANIKATLKSYFDTIYGAIGSSLPAGGLAGQVLEKDSGADYDASWHDITPGAGDVGWHIDGALSVEDDVPNANIVTKPMTIEAAFLYCKNAGSAGSTIVDVLCNGVSILKDAFVDNRLVLAYDDVNQWVSVVPLTLDFVEGDILTVNIDQVATGVEDAVIALQVGVGGTMSRFNLTVKELDGSPSVPNVDTISIDGATVTDDGGGAATITVPSKVAQIVHTTYTTMSTGTTVIPQDDTIPQNTEGDEYFTCAVTPKNASNILKIDVNVYGSVSVQTGLNVALFKNTDADALACGRKSDAANYSRVVSFTHWMTAGTISTITFKIRAGGGAAGTTTINGTSGARFFGGILPSTIIITEYTP